MPKRRGGKGVNKDEEGENDSQEEDEKTGPAEVGGNGRYDLAPSTVTLSGLLNAIDGVSSQVGVLLVVAGALSLTKR